MPSENISFLKSSPSLKPGKYLIVCSSKYIEGITNIWEVSSELSIKWNTEYQYD